MNDEAKVSLMKIAAQMTETILQDKSGFGASVIDAARNNKKTDYFAVFDYCLQYLTETFNR